MGKRSKKIKKNIDSVHVAEKSQKNVALQAQKVLESKEKIAQMKEQGEYLAALNEIIALFEADYVDVELLYETANLYWLDGDYDRAFIWTEKTLSYKKDHADAHLLLAKIYAFQDKEEESLQALERALVLAGGVIPEETRLSAENLLDYFEVDEEKEALAEKYPLVWGIVTGTLQEEIVAPAVEEPISVNDDAAEQEQSSVLAAPVVEAPALEAPVQAISAEAQEAQEAQDVYADLYHKPAQEVVEAVMQQPLSLVEKVDLCLHFAVYYYTKNDRAKTLMLLKQAYLIDGKNDLVLKNIGFVLAEMGDKAGALEFLPKVKTKDLSVLHQIKVLCAGKRK